MKIVTVFPCSSRYIDTAADGDDDFGIFIILYRSSPYFYLNPVYLD